MIKQKAPQSIAFFYSINYKNHRQPVTGVVNALHSYSYFRLSHLQCHPIRQT